MSHKSDIFDTHPVRQAIRECLTALNVKLDQFEHTTQGHIGCGGIQGLAEDLVEAWKDPRAYTVSCLSQAIEHLLYNGRKPHTLQDASHVLWKRYVEPPAKDANVASIGITDKEIILYIKKQKKGYPETVADFPVRVVVCGDLMIGGA